MFHGIWDREEYANIVEISRILDAICFNFNKKITSRKNSFIRSLLPDFLMSKNIAFREDRK